MAKLSAIRADVTKETEGIWFEYEVGIRLLIARAGNPRFSKVLSKLSQPHLKNIRSKSFDSSDILEEITKRAVAEAILLGWENIEDDKGKTVKYSAEQAYEFFIDPSLHDFYQFVTICSADREEFRLELEVDAAKN